MDNGNTGDWNTGDWNTGHRNTGDWNTGHRNTGHRNTGFFNTGDWNTGFLNTGDWNTGDWNTGDRNTGFFNTTTPEEINCFNVPTPRNLWNECYTPNWLYKPTTATWVTSGDMTAKEKEENPSHETCGGYLRVNDMREEWKKAYESASEEDIQAVRDLPNFDYDVFEEITGLDLRPDNTKEDCSGKTVVIDGVEYTLSRKEDS